MSRTYVFNNLVNGAKNSTPSCVFLDRNIRKFCQSSYKTAGNVSLTAYGTAYQGGNVSPGFKMMKRNTIINSNSLVINPIVHSSNNPIVAKTNYIRTNRITLLNSNLPPPPETSVGPTPIDHLLDITIKDKYLGKLIVEKISALLPKVDSIGHNILHANNEFIDYILIKIKKGQPESCPLINN